MNKELKPCCYHIILVNLTMEYSSFDIQKYPTLSVKEGYKEWVNTYDDSVEDEMDIRLLERIRSVNWKKITSGIDLACGTGRIGVWLKQKGVKVIDGIDFTSEMLQKAREKGVYNNLVHGDILDTEFGNDSYAFSIEVLTDEHIPDLKPLYSEAARITKKDGLFIIVGYHPHFLMNGLVTHFHREGGEAVAIKSYVHLLSDHIKAAFKARLSLLEMDEGIIDSDWLNKKPKWIKYKDRPISFIMVWKK